MPRGGRRAEPDIHRTIGIDDDVLVLAAQAWELLVGLHHRAGLVVICDKRPEVRGDRTEPEIRRCQRLHTGV